MTSEVFNIYCDESCHLENDYQPVMLLGAMWFPFINGKVLNKEINDLKEKFHARGEIKWTKVSKSRIDFFLEIVRWFFSHPCLHYRCFVVFNKNRLDHSVFNNDSHDDLYYKMYFSLLRPILDPNNKYNIYIDIKDARSKLKLQELKNVFSNDKYDFTRQMIRNVQHVRSHGENILQIADFLTGALSYKHRSLTTSKEKLQILKAIESNVNFSLLSSTSLKEEKFNIFIWTPWNMEG